MSVEFGKGSWPFEQGNQRIIKTEVVQVPNTVGMNISIVHYQRKDGRLGISLQANISLYHWREPKIEEAVRKFLRIEDRDAINVRTDEFTQVVTFDLRKRAQPIDYPLIQH